MCQQVAPLISAGVLTEETAAFESTPAVFDQCNSAVWSLQSKHCPKHCTPLSGMLLTHH
jgi:hypothetical protein